MQAFLCGFNGFNQLTTHSCSDYSHTMDNPNPILTVPTKMQLELYDHKNSANHNSELSRKSEIKSVAVSWSNVYLVHDDGSVSVTGHLQDTWQKSDIIKSLSEIQSGDNAIEHVAAAWDRVFIINKRGECMVYKSTVEATRSHLESKRKFDELQKSECNDTGTRKKVFKARNRLIRESLPDVSQPELLDNDNLVQNTTSVNQLYFSSCDNAAIVNKNGGQNSAYKLNSDSVNSDLCKANSLVINTSSCSSSVDLSSDSATNTVMNSSQSKIKFNSVEANDKFVIVITQDNKLYTYPIKQAEKSPTVDKESLIADSFQPLDLRLLRSISLDSVVSSLSCGKQFVLLCTTQGQVYSFGSGGHGELGHGNLENQSEPRIVEMLEGVFVTCVAAGGWHSVVRGKCGELYVWGWNERGQLGLPSRGVGGKDDRKLSNNRLNGTDPAELNQNYDSVKSSHRKEIKVEGNTEDFVNIISEPQLLDIRLNHACDQSKVDNSIATNTDNDDFVEVSKIACGSRHTVALTEDGRVLAWGWNEYGQLGLGDVKCVDKPTVIQYFIDNSVTAKDVFAGYWNSVFVV